MLNLNMNANFNGSSVKDDVVIATFNASYNGEKNIYIVKSKMRFACIVIYCNWTFVMPKNICTFTKIARFFEHL